MISKKQKRVLDAIEEFLTKKGYSPSIREIGKELGLASPSTVHKHIVSLERKGFIRRGEEGVELILKRPHLSIPLVGLVPAGNPEKAFENLGETVEIPSFFSPERKELFALKVKGKSMIDAYIDEGDIVIIEKSSIAQSGEMVIASLEDGSVTLKRLKKENSSIYLVPENPDYQPIKVEELRVLGKVVGVLRKY
ncbi:MAG: transcriptional repressor LexA [Acidobacteriota bacterium]